LDAVFIFVNKNVNFPMAKKFGSTLH
jgi:hypothetical protein